MNETPKKALQIGTLPSSKSTTARSKAKVRMIALAPRSGIVYYVAFVDRGTVRRIISLRRANRREVKHYVESSDKGQN